MKTARLWQSLALAMTLLIGSAIARAETAAEVTQYGITWTFEKPATIGRFVTGDYWVVGPVSIVSVRPIPGPAPEGDRTKVTKNQFGDEALQDDRRMRNGSMLVTKPGGSQGFDSRLKNYKPELSVKLPHTLRDGESLISTISNDDVNQRNFVEKMMRTSEKNGQLVLKSDAILTCVDKPPPADAFRPGYLTGDHKHHRLTDVKWDLLPKLKSPRNVPSWEEYERYFERPWLDHVSSWLVQRMGPSDNQPNYGREVARVVSVASLMVELDAPSERKEKLAIGLIQFGIDSSALAKAGRQWQGDGGHWNGRKWPILFASLMLGDTSLLPPEGAIFSEDQQTYYGKGFFGHDALYQMVGHHGPRRPYEERSPDEWDDMDKQSESYRLCCTSRAWVGTALAAQHMGAKKLWGHDAFFDYADRWMSKNDLFASKRGEFKRPKDEGSTMDPFVDAMWEAHRAAVPKQAGAEKNWKWVWIDNEGKFAPNAIGDK